jgi:hypothetical protein
MCLFKLSTMPFENKYIWFSRVVAKPEWRYRRWFSRFVVKSERRYRRLFWLQNGAIAAGSKQNGAIAADLNGSVKLFRLNSSFEPFTILLIYVALIYFLFWRKKQRCKKEQGLKNIQHGKNQNDGKKKRSPRNQERDRERSAHRRQMFNRKKTLESMGLTEEEHGVEFSYNQDAPSRSPSPGRITKCENSSQKPVSPPPAAVVARIQVAKPSQRARRILLKALK